MSASDDPHVGLTDEDLQGFGDRLTGWAKEPPTEGPELDDLLRFARKLHEEVMRLRPPLQRGEVRIELWDNTVPVALDFASTILGEPWPPSSLPYVGLVHGQGDGKVSLTVHNSVGREL